MSTTFDAGTVDSLKQNEVLGVVIQSNSFCSYCRHDGIDLKRCYKCVDNEFRMFSGRKVIEVVSVKKQGRQSGKAET